MMPLLAEAKGGSQAPPMEAGGRRPPWDSGRGDQPSLIGNNKLSNYNNIVNNLNIHMF